MHVKGGMLAEAVRAYVAHPAREELAERALQEVRAARASSGNAPRELGAAGADPQPGERTLRAVL